MQDSLTQAELRERKLLALCDRAGFAISLPLGDKKDDDCATRTALSLKHVTAEICLFWNAMSQGCCGGNLALPAADVAALAKRRRAAICAGRDQTIADHRVGGSAAAKLRVVQGSHQQENVHGPAAKVNRIVEVCALIIAPLITGIVISSSYASGLVSSNALVPSDPPSTIGGQPGTNAVSIVSGSVNGSWLTLAYDLAVTLNDGDNFRVLPVVGEGGGQNIRDILHLKGVDLGITAINVLNKLRIDGQLGVGDEKIVYITQLGNDMMHVLVRADSGITSLQQLDGKKVNLNSAGSATEAAAYEIFDRLGIKPIGSNMGQADAYARLSRGDIAATFQLGGNPAPAVARLRARDGFRLLPVPYDLRLPQEYLPATLTGDDYPALIPVGEHIDTLAVGTLMIAYNWPKNTDGYRRIAEFVDRFFSRFAALQRPPRYPAWRELNLAATLPTWKRFPEAQAWLNSRRPPALGGTPGTRN